MFRVRPYIRLFFYNFFSSFYLSLNTYFVDVSLKPTISIHLCDVSNFKQPMIRVKVENAILDKIFVFCFCSPLVLCFISFFFFFFVILWFLHFPIIPFLCLF